MSRAERLGLMVAALPGLAALGALLATWMSIDQSRSELRIAEQSQITNRFNAAVKNLGSDSEDVRLGGFMRCSASCRTPGATSPPSYRC
jgi:hypothetical protein